MKRVDVEAFLREDLLPRLLPRHARVPGAVLVLDNARIHHGGEIEKIVSGAGCCVLYLPPYSPDFSPIAMYRTKIEGHFRRLFESSCRITAGTNAATSPALGGIG